MTDPGDPVTTAYTDDQLDALGEVANIASATAATALSRMLGRPVDISVSGAASVALTDAVEACGDADAHVCGIVLPVEGDLEALVLLLLPLEQAEAMCGLLGAVPGSAVGDSALREIGNILGTAYLSVLAAMARLELRPRPPLMATDLLGAIVASLLAHTAGDADSALVLDSALTVAGEAASMSFLLLPTRGSIGDLLARLGLAEPAS